MGLDLVTLQEYKTYAGISSPNQDSRISSIITKASQLVKSICRRTFLDYVDEAKTEYFTGGAYFQLDETPIISIQSVEWSSDKGKTYTSLTEYDDWVLDNALNEIVPTAGSEFLHHINGYKVTYTAGYPDGIPEDLKLAILDLVTYYLNNDSAVHSPKAPGTNSVQIEYISASTLPAHIKRVLDLYMNHYS